MLFLIKRSSDHCICVIINDFRHGTSTCWTPENWVSSIQTMTCPTTPSTVLHPLKIGTLSFRDHGYKLHKRYSNNFCIFLFVPTDGPMSLEILVNWTLLRFFFFSVLHNQPQRPPPGLSKPERVHQRSVPPHRWLLSQFSLWLIISALTGFLVTPLGRSSCTLGYVAHSDPGGQLPSWVTNKLSSILAPKMVKRIHKACLNYVAWKVSFVWKGGYTTYDVCNFDSGWTIPDTNPGSILSKWRLSGSCWRIASSE